MIGRFTISLSRQLLFKANGHKINARLCWIAPENRYALRTHNCGQLRLEHVGKSVKLCGWLRHERLLRFLVIGDTYGSVQVFNGRKDDELREIIKNLSRESVVEVEGQVCARPPKDCNPNLPTGEVEVHLASLRVLNPSKKPLPVDVHGFVTPNLMPRLKYRYLDLRRPEMQRALRFRADVISKMRGFLEKHHFVEVETPTLFRRTPGGAREFVVPSSSEPGQFYSLPQSPQQFKQLLMVAGLDRYFQIARCYRDESLKSDRQPEFTQLDIELSFTDQENVMLLVEDVIKASWPAEISDKYRPPIFERMTYGECMKKYGTDKPDLRYDWRIHRAVLKSGAGSTSVSSESGAGSTPNEPSGAGPLRTIYIMPVPDEQDTVVDETLEKWRTKLQGLHPWARNFLCYKRTDYGSYISTCGRCRINLEDLAFDEEESDDAIRQSNLLFGVHIDDETQNTNGLKTLGLLRQWSADHMEAKGLRVRRDEMKFLWVTDFPLFLKQDPQKGSNAFTNTGSGTDFTVHEESTNWESAHHPFTAAKAGQIIAESGSANNPGDLIGQHYDLVLNGTELGGGSVRIHDSSTQRYVLGEILKENCDDMQHLLEAFEYGAPPHAGFAIGLDRYIALLLKVESIRDVIAFPKITGGKDLMTQAPSTLPEEILSSYHIRVSAPKRKDNDKRSQNEEDSNVEETASESKKSKRF